VAPLAVAGLNEHFAVRTIHVVTKSYANCAAFLAMARNVECHVEHDLIPGVNFHRVQQHLAQRFAGDAASAKVARERTGWYLQQLVKLGVTFALHGLSEHFMIWDLDMIPLRPFPLFFAAAGGGAGVAARADISAVRIREYEASYHKLFGQRAAYPRSGMSFVAHWVMVYKPFMLEMLGELSRPGDPLSWPWVILDSVYPGERNVYYGFSEYTTYVSWVLQRKPGHVHVMPEKDWMRVGPKKHQWLKSIDYDGCCPDQGVLEKAQQQRWSYFGWELGGGHSPECAHELNSLGVEGLGFKGKGVSLA